MINTSAPNHLKHQYTEHTKRLWRIHGLAPLLPLFLTLVVCPNRPGFPYGLKGSPNYFDEGLLLTIRRFSSFHLLPYKDLWTLYGPGQSLLAPLFHLFGRHLFMHRVFNIAMLEIFVLIVYLIYSKVVNPWTAATFASVVGLFTVPISYLTSYLVLLPGIYLAFIPGDWKTTRPMTLGRLMWGLTLIGCALLGRVDYGLIAVWALLVTLIFWRRVISTTWLWRIGVAASAPGLLFVGYLATVGLDRVVENFFRYPFVYYSLVKCRGTPIDWPATWHLAISPLFNGMWSPDQLVVVLGDLVLPALGIILFVGGILRGPAALRPFLVFVGGCDLFIFRSMWARTGQFPVPTLPFVLLSIGALSLWLRYRWPLWGSRVATATAVFVGFSVIPHFVPGALKSWTKWPPYDPVLGFCDRSAEINPDLVGRLKTEVDRVAKPNEPIFIALEHNGGDWANAAVLYWALDHPPATRFFEFDPCLTDREDIQEIMVRDLARVNVIITTNFGQGNLFSYPPASALDDFINRHFQRRRIVYNGDERYRVYVRSSGPLIDGAIAPSWKTVPELTSTTPWTVRDDDYLVSGWYAAEPGFGAWSAGTEAVLSYRPPATPAKSLRLVLLAVAGKEAVPFSVVYETGRITGVIPASKAVGIQSFTVRLPIGSGPDAHTVRVLTKELHSPAGQGLGADIRKMGIGIHALGADNCPPSPKIDFRPANAPETGCEN